jgi:hypothetical protein
MAKKRFFPAPENTLFSVSRKNDPSVKGVPRDWQ